MIGQGVVVGVEGVAASHHVSKGKGELDEKKQYHFGLFCKSDNYVILKTENSF